jgi:ABC-type antimicrobial peptide transport system permease subunit
MFEFGVLRAVGTRPFSMAMIIISEAGSIALVSIVFGIIMGILVTLIVGHFGINYSGIDFGGVTFSDPIRPIFRIYQYIVYPSLLFVFTVLIGIYPGHKAAKITPVQAMKKKF